MLKVSNLELRFNTRVLFSEVNLEFKDDNCYGIIGANGAGKSTFLKILSGELESTKGEIILGKGERISVLKQNHNEFDDYSVLDTVIMGNSNLYKVMKEREAIYFKPDFSMEDGMKAATLEEKFASMNGWQAESDAALLLSGLGIKNDKHSVLMKDLKDSEKVKVLLARALFGDPDILLLDEPTNGLDNKSKIWLEDFLMDFKNTVLVVSHDRYFLNKVCTHIADIDYAKIQLYVGNYDFWYESSQLVQRQMRESNKKKEDKIKELQEFIARFSANASKSKQATSRKKMLEKIELDEIKPSSRKYPYIDFKLDRDIGNDVLTVKNLYKTVDGEKILDNVSFTLTKEDKVAFVGDGIAISMLFSILAGEEKPDAGVIKYGQTITTSYFPKDNSKYFKTDVSLLDWLREYSKEKDDTFVRSFLGRMLFSGEEGLKKANVISGGEKVRCMLAKMMLSGANLLILDQPTNHLDMESITALNNGLISYKGVLLFSSYDHQFVQTTANRIIEVTNSGIVDRKSTYDEYLDYSETERKIVNEN